MAMLVVLVSVFMMNIEGVRKVEQLAPFFVGEFGRSNSRVQRNIGHKEIAAW